MPMSSTRFLPYGLSAVVSIRADALDIAAPLPIKHVEDAGRVAWTNAAEYDLFHLIVIGVKNCVAPIDFLEALVCRLFTTGRDRVQNSPIRAKSGGDRDLGDNG